MMKNKATHILAPSQKRVDEDIDTALAISQNNAGSVSHI